MKTGPNKGPQGHSDYGADSEYMPEPQERYEEEGERDVITGDRSLDPFDHRAPETDHTPNHTEGPKPSKPEYGRHEGRGDGGVGL